jgi:hypothetical protein
MTNTCTRSVLATLLILALAGPAAAQSRASDREKRSACGGRPDSCAPQLSPADRENLSRAMSRNVLHSIDDRLRRQRYN